MAQINLQFGAPGYGEPVGTVDLQFGTTDGGGDVETLAARLAVTLPAPTVAISATVPKRALRVSAQLPAPLVTAQARLVLRAQLAVTQPAPSVAAAASVLVRAQLAATLPKPVAMARATRDINVYRDPSVIGGSAWQQASALGRHTAGAYGESARHRAHTASRYQQAAALSRATTAPAAMLPRQWRRVLGRAELAAAVAAATQASNRHLPRERRRQGDTWQDAAREWIAAAARNRYLPHLRKAWGLPYEQASRILARHWGSDWQLGEWRPLGWRDDYQDAQWPPPGISPHPVEPPEPGPEPYTPSLDLQFCAPPPSVWDLAFGVDPCADLEPPDDGRVPIQRTYLVSNSASLTLVATGQALEASAISVAIDADSWAWELRATVIGEPSIALVREAPQPVELEATLNGHTWRVVLDDWQRSRAWGELPAITLSARSLAAYLGAPHAAARSYTETQTRTARQLAEQELPLGWTLDWQIDDWLVEPAAWHYTNRTPIEAISAIATAAGAVVQAHPSQPRLIIAPRYAAPHWAWQGEAPDVTLPPDILTRLGSQYRPSEALNAVYVSGETTGVLALVKRAGTAGDRLGEMIVDPLITRQAPARGRGIAVLSASGEQTRETLALPVASDLAGLLATGQLLRVDPDGDDWRGLVRAVSVAARLEGSGNRAALVVEQTAELERHLEETA
ncbi:hypothetical protein SAMN04487957_10599 [Halomonas shengliensis]|uniref:Uncharacterized protein n=1 Tax=Halomonas shengliensis TaxID=419597 RepID=A0A1H0IFG0_9GAMM|nr:hypothetical protein [Halomonas shengliensis]SDO30076.1 hypothetical protein SAMN04487957_10599 [Halomonas shengliensis]